MVDWNVAAVAVKAFLYASCLFAAGGIFFLAIFNSALAADERARILAFVRAAAIFGLYAIIARIAIASGMLGDSIAGMWDWSLIEIVLDSSEGTAAAVRIVGLVAIAVSAFRTGGSQALSLAGAVLAVASFALTGHTQSLPSGAWGSALLAAHLLAVAYWIGALPPLLIVTHDGSTPRLATILQRFSSIALLVVTGLAAAGATVLWLILASFEALFASAYGQLVLVKLLFVVVLLALAATNKLRFTPRIAAGDASAVAGLRRSIVAEIAVASAILTTTAAFTTVVGPPEAEAPAARINEQMNKLGVYPPGVYAVRREARA